MYTYNLFNVNNFLIHFSIPTLTDYLAELLQEMDATPKSKKKEVSSFHPNNRFANRELKLFFYERRLNNMPEISRNDSGSAPHIQKASGNNRTDIENKKQYNQENC